jgi:hypothetical protein
MPVPLDVPDLAVTGQAAYATFLLSISAGSAENAQPVIGEK